MFMLDYEETNDESVPASNTGFTRDANAPAQTLTIAEDLAGLQLALDATWVVARVAGRAIEVVRAEVLEKRGLQPRCLALRYTCRRLGCTQPPLEWMPEGLERSVPPAQT